MLKASLTISLVEKKPVSRDTSSSKWDVVDGKLNTLPLQFFLIIAMSIKGETSVIINATKTIKLIELKSHACLLHLGWWHIFFLSSRQHCHAVADIYTYNLLFVNAFSNQLFSKASHPASESSINHNKINIYTELSVPCVCVCVCVCVCACVCVRVCGYVHTC